MSYLTRELQRIEADPLGKLVRSLAPGSELARRALAQYEADAQALADVRTLEHFAEQQECQVPAVWKRGGIWFCELFVYEPSRVPYEFQGATPDAARAKAAAWVREQKP